MNTIWSDHVQGVQTLYLSRKLRFDDCFSAQLQALLRLDRNRAYRILEIGCGPGALSGALRRWYPAAELHAIDRDSRFIAFAAQHEPGIDFSEGDAACLPFADDSFDVTISYTVQEHIEPAAFWGEQRRVLKPGGVCICLSARKGIQCTAPCLEPTEAERQFWAAKPDAQAELEAIRHADSLCAGPVIAAVNAKYDARLRLYRAGVKQWDTAVSVIMAVRGTK